MNNPRSPHCHRTGLRGVVLAACLLIVWVWNGHAFAEYTNLHLVPQWSDGHLVVQRQAEDGRWQRVTVDLQTAALSIEARQADNPLDDQTVAGPALPSTPGGGPAFVSFENRCKHAVRAFWRDTGNRLHPYATIEPGQTWTQSSYVGHSWEFRTNEKPPRLIGHHQLSSDGRTIRIVGEPTKIPEPHRWSHRPATDAMGTAVENDRPVKNGDGTFEAMIDADAIRFRRCQPEGPEADEWKSPSLGLAPAESPTIEQNGPETRHRPNQSPVHRDARWSPSGDRLVWWQTIPAPARPTHWLDHSEPQANSGRSSAAQTLSHPSDRFRATLWTDGYRLPGDPMPSHRLVVWDVQQNAEVSHALPAIDFGSPKVTFSENDILWIDHVDRGHRRARLTRIALSDGNTRSIVEETSDTFIWTNHGPPVPRVQFSPDRNEVLWASERSGRRRLFLVDAHDGSVRPLTHGTEIVRDVLHVDWKRRFIDVALGNLSDASDPYYVRFARVQMDDESITRIGDADGNHRAEFSPDRRHAVLTHSRVDRPPVHEIWDVEAGKRIAELATSRWTGDASPPALPVRFSAAGRDGKTQIYGVAFLPPDIDARPAESVPVVEQIYAGPHGFFVPKDFRSSHGHSRWTNRGVALVQIDGMGTAGRGKAFHDVCHKDLRDAGFPDRKIWIRKLAERFPALDVQRVGIYGTSAGGQSAVAALLHHGEFYKAAVAACGCHDNRMDKASWNEQWMGYPVDESYSRSSNIEHASKLRGNLMLIVGLMDRNVPPESTLRLADALIRNDRDFELIALPSGGHTDGGAYGRRRTVEFLAGSLGLP